MEETKNIEKKKNPFDFHIITIWNYCIYIIVQKDRTNRENFT